MGARRLAIVALAMSAVLVACSEDLPVDTPTDAELREQIHAATGHEPEQCSDNRNHDAELVIGESGVEPKCIIVSKGASLTIINADGQAHRFFVGDPANNEVGRHIRVDAQIESQGEYELDEVASLLGVGIYPYWVQGAQEDGFEGTIVVRS
jgi:hypothetical protein